VPRDLLRQVVPRHAASMQQSAWVARCDSKGKRKSLPTGGEVTRPRRSGSGAPERSGRTIEHGQLRPPTTEVGNQA
jgi:hypothetical protein